MHVLLKIYKTGETTQIKDNMKHCVGTSECLFFPLFFAIITTRLHFAVLQISIICSCTMLTIISKCRGKVKITQLHQKNMTNVMKWRTANCEFKAPKESQSKKSFHVSQKNNINLSCPMLWASLCVFRVHH